MSEFDDWEQYRHDGTMEEPEPKAKKPRKKPARRERVRVKLSHSYGGNGFDGPRRERTWIARVKPPVKLGEWHDGGVVVEIYEGEGAKS